MSLHDLKPCLLCGQWHSDVMSCMPCPRKSIETEVVLAPQAVNFTPENHIWVMHDQHDGMVVWYGLAEWCSYSTWIIPNTDPYTEKYVDSA